MFKYFLSFLCLSFIASPFRGNSFAQSEKGGPQDWVMHIYVGGRLFEDKLHLEKSTKGQWKGTITVPNLFTVPVKNVSYTKKGIYFDIEADEGKGPFHVKYVGTFYPGTDTFSGFATVTDDNTLLGGFVGQKLNIE